MIAAGSSACTSTNPCPPNAMRLHSLPGVLFWDLDRSQWPDLQQSFFAVGNMKYCGHDTQPPKSSVAIMSAESSRLESARSTILIISCFSSLAPFGREANVCGREFQGAALMHNHAQVAQHVLPCQASQPSLAITGTMSNPAAGSAHHQPNSAFNRSPQSRIADR